MDNKILVRIMKRNWADELVNNGKLMMSTIQVYREFRRAGNIKNTHDEWEAYTIYDAAYPEVSMTGEMREMSEEDYNTNYNVTRKGKVIEIEAIDTIEFEDVCTIEMETVGDNKHFISCWGMIDNTDEAKKDYFINNVEDDERSEMVMVESCIDNVIMAFTASELGLIRHGEMKYDQQNRPKNKGAIFDVFFHKRKKFENQKEYRFVLGRTSNDNCKESRLITLRGIKATKVEF